MSAPGWQPRAAGLLGLLVAAGLLTDGGTARGTPAAVPVLAGQDTRFTLEQLGLGPDVLRTATRARIDVPFPSRKDRVLTAARLVLSPAAQEGPAAVAMIEVLVNGERVGALDGPKLAEVGREHVMSIDPAFLAEHNTLTVRLRGADAGDCDGRVPPGTWRALGNGRLEIRTTPLRLGHDLALLPMPFFDEAFDREPSLAIALAGPVGSAHVRVAALVASWFGQRARGRLRFPVSIGQLPETGAVVIADGPAAAAALGVPAVDAPTLFLADHPSGKGGTRKLLVLGGRDLDDVEAVAIALATGQSFTGASAVVPARPMVPALAAYAAPRWLVTGTHVPLAPAMGNQPARVDGRQSATITVGFRLAPDLFLWEAARPALELDFGVRVPRGAPAPQVALELNGRFIGTLPPGAGRRRVRLPINREDLIGFNQLAVHVDHRRSDCDEDKDERGGTAFWIEPGSALILSKPAHFVALPDLSLFLDDGFPFTRHPDLAGTTAVIPERPTPQEIEALLTTVAHFSGITGVAGTGLAVTTAAALPRGPHRGRDLLVVGAAGNQPLLQRWRERLPLSFDAGRPAAEAPVTSWTERGLALLAGRFTRGQIARANEILETNDAVAIAMAIASPLAPGRSAVFVTAARPEWMPTLSRLQGFAESRDPKEDLLLVAGEERWMFRLGPAYESGDLDTWRRFLWSLSQHWVGIFPFTLGGVAIAAGVMGAGLRRRLRARQGEKGQGP